MTDWTDHILKTKIKWNHTRWWMTTKRILYNNIVVIKICTRTLLLNKYISAHGNFPCRKPNKIHPNKNPDTWVMKCPPSDRCRSCDLVNDTRQKLGCYQAGPKLRAKGELQGGKPGNRWNSWRIRGPKTWIPGKENHGLSPLTDRGLCFPPSKSPEKIHGANLHGGCILTTVHGIILQGVTTRWLNAGLWKQQKVPKTTAGCFKWWSSWWLKPLWKILVKI